MDTKNEDNGMTLVGVVRNIQDLEDLKDHEESNPN